MWRRTFLAFGLFAAIHVLMTPNLVRAAERLDVDTIKRALQVTEEENNGFIERVVSLMNQGTLARKDVTAAFLKARQRTKHQFQYFKYAVIRLADREGVSLAQPVRRDRPTTAKTWWQRLWAMLRR